MAAETVAILHLTTIIGSSSCSGLKLWTKKWPEIGPDWPPKESDLVLYIIFISLKFLHTSPWETPIIIIIIMVHIYEHSSGAI